MTFLYDYRKKVFYYMDVPKEEGQLHFDFYRWLLEPMASRPPLLYFPFMHIKRSLEPTVIYRDRSINVSVKYSLVVDGAN